MLDFGSYFDFEVIRSTCMFMAQCLSILSFATNQCSESPDSEIGTHDDNKA